MDRNDGKPKMTPKQGQIARQCMEVEEMLVRGMGTRRLVLRCKEEWDVAEATVYKRIRMVRDAWAAEAKKYDRTAKRDEHRSRLLRLYNMAVNRMRPLRDAEGNPVIDPKTDKPFMVEEPDLRTAVKVLDSMSKLDNLDERVVPENAANDLVSLMQMAGVIDDKQRAAGLKN